AMAALFERWASDPKSRGRVFHENMELLLIDPKSTLLFADGIAQLGYADDALQLLERVAHTAPHGSTVQTFALRTLAQRYDGTSQAVDLRRQILWNTLLTSHDRASTSRSSDFHLVELSKRSSEVHFAVFHATLNGNQTYDSIAHWQRLHAASPGIATSHGTLARQCRQMGAIDLADRIVHDTGEFLEAQTRRFAASKVFPDRRRGFLDAAGLPDLTTAP
ncbi:MAG: hypothetical protein AAFN70_14805, partial [Planctomycetota bacterium]